jgi:hypothetical protein
MWRSRSPTSNEEVSGPGSPFRLTGLSTISAQAD